MEAIIDVAVWIGGVILFVVIVWLGVVFFPGPFEVGLNWIKESCDYCKEIDSIVIALGIK